MRDINTTLLCLSTLLSNPDLRHLQLISYALLAMNGRVSMLGISRWTEKGGSYRTIQRFFGRAISWCRVNWYLIRHHLPDKDDVILIAGDTTTVTKSGKQTYGLDRWFSSIYNRAVPGVSFFTLSLISVKQRHALPVMTEQVDPANRTRPKKRRNLAKRSLKIRNLVGPEAVVTRFKVHRNCLGVYCGYRLCCVMC